MLFFNSKELEALKGDISIMSFVTCIKMCTHFFLLFIMGYGLKLEPGNILNRHERSLAALCPKPNRRDRTDGTLTLKSLKGDPCPGIK